MVVASAVSLIRVSRGALVRGRVGIMKARHRILRGRIALRNAGDIDAVMFTCAILHNMLLKDDGQFNARSNARARAARAPARAWLCL